MSDLDIMLKTKELYLQQKYPQEGFWYDRGYFNDCFCIEGCLIAALGFEESFVAEVFSGRDPKLHGWYDRNIVKHPVYKKLLDAIDGYKPGHLYSINDNKEKVLKTLDTAIVKERESYAN